MAGKKPRRKGDDDEDWDGLGYMFVATSTGDISQLVEYPTKRKIKKRPIGFLANIDEFIED